MLNSILTIYGLRTGSASLSQTTPSYNIIPSTPNFPTVSASSLPSILHILSTRMSTMLGAREVTLTISGATTEKILVLLSGVGRECV
jgi:hypothetical protein